MNIRRPQELVGLPFLGIFSSKIYPYQAEKESFTMAKVESFTLDHTNVKAPYVRLITVEEWPN